eukprot:g78911.t1
MLSAQLPNSAGRAEEAAGATRGGRTGGCELCPCATFLPHFWRANTCRDCSHRKEAHQATPQKAADQTPSPAPASDGNNVSNGSNGSKPNGVNTLLARTGEGISQSLKSVSKARQLAAMFEAMSPPEESFYLRERETREVAKSASGSGKAALAGSASGSGMVALANSASGSGKGGGHARSDSLSQSGEKESKDRERALWSHDRPTRTHVPSLLTERRGSAYSTSGAQPEPEAGARKFSLPISVKKKPDEDNNNGSEVVVRSSSLPVSPTGKAAPIHRATWEPPQQDSAHVSSGADYASNAKTDSLGHSHKTEYSALLDSHRDDIGGKASQQQGTPEGAEPDRGKEPAAVSTSLSNKMSQLLPRSARKVKIQPLSSVKALEQAEHAPAPASSPSSSIAGQSLVKVPRIQALADSVVDTPPFPLSNATTGSSPAAAAGAASSPAVPLLEEEEAPTPSHATAGLVEIAASKPQEESPKATRSRGRSSSVNLHFATPPKGEARPSVGEDNRQTELTRGMGSAPEKEDQNKENRQESGAKEDRTLVQEREVGKRPQLNSKTGRTDGEVPKSKTNAASVPAKQTSTQQQQVQEVELKAPRRDDLVREKEKAQKKDNTETHNTKQLHHDKKTGDFNEASKKQEKHAVDMHAREVGAQLAQPSEAEKAAEQAADKRPEQLLDSLMPARVMVQELAAEKRSQQVPDLEMRAQEKAPEPGPGHIPAHSKTPERPAHQMPAQSKALEQGSDSQVHAQDAQGNAQERAADKRPEQLPDLQMPAQDKAPMRTHAQGEASERVADKWPEQGPDQTSGQSKAPYPGPDSQSRAQGNAPEKAADKRPEKEPESQTHIQEQPDNRKLQPDTDVSQALGEIQETSRNEAGTKAQAETAKTEEGKSKGAEESQKEEGSRYARVSAMPMSEVQQWLLPPSPGAYLVRCLYEHEGDLGEDQLSFHVGDVMAIEVVNSAGDRSKADEDGWLQAAYRPGAAMALARYEPSSGIPLRDACPDFARGFVPAEYVQPVSIEKAWMALLTSAFPNLVQEPCLFPARALHPYTATGAGQLSLEEGEEVEVLEEVPGGWLRVRRGNKAQAEKGLVPLKYLSAAPGQSSVEKDDEVVELLEEGEEAASPPASPRSLRAAASAAAAEDSSSNSATEDPRISTASSAARSYRALYDFVAEGPDQASFVAGEVLMVLDAETQGWVPIHSSRRSPLGKSGQPKRRRQRHLWAPLSCLLALPTSDEVEAFEQAAPKHIRAQSIGTALALFAYQAQAPDQMSFQAGEVLCVLGMHSSGWWKVCDQQGEAVGLAARTFLFLLSNNVEQLEKDELEKEEQLAKQRLSLEKDEHEEGDTKQDIRTDSEGNEHGYWEYRCAFDYVSEDPEQLSFQEGQTVVVRVRQTDGWFRGYHKPNANHPSLAQASSSSPSDAAPAAAISPRSSATSPLSPDPTFAPSRHQSDDSSTFFTEPSDLSLPALLMLPSSFLSPSPLVGPALVKKHGPATAFTAQWEYEPTDATHIAMCPGEVIMVTDQAADGWWAAFHQNEPARSGLVPAAFLAGTRGFPEPESPPAAPSLRAYCTALFDYEPEDGDGSSEQLSFQEGQHFLLLEEEDSDGWWRVKDTRGRVGLVPSNHVEKAETGFPFEHAARLVRSQQSEDTDSARSINLPDQSLPSSRAESVVVFGEAEAEPDNSFGTHGLHIKVPTISSPADPMPSSYASATPSSLAPPLAHSLAPTPSASSAPTPSNSLNSSALRTRSSSVPKSKGVTSLQSMRKALLSLRNSNNSRDNSPLHTQVAPFSFNAASPAATTDASYPAPAATSSPSPVSPPSLGKHKRNPSSPPLPPRPFRARADAKACIDSSSHGDVSLLPPVEHPEVAPVAALPLRTSPNKQVAGAEQAAAPQDELSQQQQQPSPQEEVIECLAETSSPVLFEAVASFAYQAQANEEISFEANDVLQVLNAQDQWWIARNAQGEAGQVPSTFVRRVVEVVCAEYDYIFEPTSEEDDPSDYLHITRGDVIKVFEKLESGWYEGWSPQTLQQGLFPGNFVKPLPLSSSQRQ